MARPGWGTRTSYLKLPLVYCETGRSFLVTGGTQGMGLVIAAW